MLSIKKENSGIKSLTNTTTDFEYPKISHCLNTNIIQENQYYSRVGYTKK